MRFSVIVACHNRKALTVRAVTRAVLAAQNAGIEVSFTIFDDGSTDGTARALRNVSDRIRVIRGDGNAYWARSMAVAETAALESQLNSEDEFIVWLNDDVELDVDAFRKVRTAIEENPGAVVVGAFRDPFTGALTYSGLARDGIHPLRFRRIFPADRPVPIDTFNGNLVAVPVDVAISLGGIDGRFPHAFADIDYGLRCARSGIHLVLAAGTLGICAQNPIPPQRPIHEEWRNFISRKGGGNYKSLKLVLRKSNRYSWFFVIMATYALWWVRRLKRNIRVSGVPQW